MTIVRTPAGAVRGRPWPHGYAFRGIPYAEPPYGDRRFRAPVPAVPWDGVRDCTTYGPTPQRVPLAAVTAIPEPSVPGDDVLSLNVFTPAPGGSGLPVLVYVHGGGYLAGSPASPWYDGAAFCRDGVVVVTVAYRLAFEGFGWVDDSPDAPANRGLRDLLLALQWVQDCIAGFGGDPARVTLAGQSAGGGCVMHLLVAPPARGLFRGAVALSGSPGDATADAARAAARELAHTLEVSADLAGFGSVPETELIAAQGIGKGFGGTPGRAGLLAAIAGMTGGHRLGPCVDGDLLPWSLAAGLSRGAGADVPLLVGSTRDEFSGIVLGAAALLEDDDPVDLLVRTGLDPGTAATYAQTLGTMSPAQVLARSLTDRLFRRRVVEWAAVRATAPAPTFVYDFAWRSDAESLSGHCLDVPFFWDVLAEPHVARLTGQRPPQSLADDVHQAAVAFVRDGDPGWPRWTAAGPVMTWDSTSSLADAGAYRSATVCVPDPRPVGTDVLGDPGRSRETS